MPTGNEVFYVNFYRHFNRFECHLHILTCVDDLL